MPLNKVSWHGPKSHLSLHRHPETSREVVEETLLILQENPFDFLLELGVPVSRWVFSIPDLLQKVWFIHLWLENWIFHSGNITLHWVFKSRFLIKRIQGTIHASLSFQIDGFLTGLFAEIGYYSTSEPNGIIGLLKCFFQTLVVWSFPIGQ